MLQLRPALPEGALPSHIKILDHIHALNQKGKVRVSDIAKSLQQTTPGVTRALKVMEGYGWIEKEVSETDRRVVYIVLTEKGLEIYTYYIHRFYCEFARRLSAFREEDIVSMMKTLSSLCDYLIEKPVVLEEKKK